MLDLRVLLLIIFSFSPIVQCATKPYNSAFMHHLQKVLVAVEWDRLHLLCDTLISECPTDEILSFRPAVHVSADLTNHSLIVQMFEQYAAPTRFNWLVFCDNCEILLNVVNVFEETHDLHGYFTYKYQWILVPSSYSPESLKAHLGKIMNLVVVAANLSMYTGMFGQERYLQEVRCKGCYSEYHHLQKKQVFPNLFNGFNNITMVMTLVLGPPYNIKESSGTYSGYYVHLMEMMAEKLNFTLRIIEPDDGQYGAFENGQWTGMIKQLIDKKADIATELSITYERSRYVMPMKVPVRHMHQVIIYHKPEPIAMSMEIIVRPFSISVWLTFVSVLVITAIIFHLTQLWKFQKAPSNDGQRHEIENTKSSSEMNRKAQNTDSVWSKELEHGCTDGGLLISFHHSQYDRAIPVEADCQEKKQSSEMSSHDNNIKHRKAFDKHQGQKIEHAGPKDYGAFVLRSTLNQGATWDPCNHSTRIIYSFYTVGWLVIMALYTGSLVSLLSVKKEIIPFRTFAELDANNEYKLGLLGGSVFYDVLYRNNFTKNDRMSYLKAKVIRDTKRDLSIISSDMEYHENQLITEKYAMFTFTDHFNSLAARSCRVAMIKEKGDWIPDGFYLQKNSAYMDDFDQVLSMIQKGDLDKNLRKMFFKTAKQCQTNLHIVSLENIHGFFYMLFGSLCVAFIALVLENLAASFMEIIERRKKLY